MMQEGWWEWAAVRAGDRVWMGGRDGAYYAVSEDPIQCPDGWADEPVLWAVVAGHGVQVRPGTKVWCQPATYRPQDEGDDTFRKAQALVAERLGGVQVGGWSERRG